MHTRLVSVNKSQKCIEQSLLLVSKTVSISQLAELSFVQMISDDEGGIATWSGGQSISYAVISYGHAVVD